MNAPYQTEYMGWNYKVEQTPDGKYTATVTDPLDPTFHHEMAGFEDFTLADFHCIWFIKERSHN